MNNTTVSAGPSAPGSPQARALSAFVWRSVRPAIGVVGRLPSGVLTTLPVMKPALNSSLAAVSPVPRGTRTTVVKTRFGDGQVRGEWVHESRRNGGAIPDPASGRSILYYLHGSGYLICSPRTHRGLVSRLVRRRGIGAFSLDYRLGPVHRFPAGGDDTVRGYRWLLDQGFAPEQIIVAGDSAGGHLAQDLIAANHRDGVGQPRAMLLISPLYDPSFDTACALERSGVRDPYIDAAAARRLLRLYTGGAAADHPRMRIQLSPEMAVPDTLIQYGAREVMADDARAIHAGILAAGGRSTLQSWANQGHVFQMFPYFTPDSRIALREAKDFLDAYVT
ncbi:putative esterase [Gordonia hirsuta DSM 44140 = NBRC 16056]|uniref:Putative esterase n=1 Tax=Gordonia hirsuta DSM 44140 = NBRC 16056 TaxID=1121927 RepID=L7L957_9ACTN|nr:alpha/beta hydrolase [Gordonia hirsuta]GAC57680.1 putative esterase [Gordonia hirsuta DSM 44140 = NBRC 16056]